MISRESNFPVISGLNAEPKPGNHYTYLDISAALGSEAICNAHCGDCYGNAGAFTKNEMTATGRSLIALEQWRNIIAQAGPYFTTLVISSIPDPMAEDNWIGHQTLIKDAFDAGFAHVVMYTNGLTMTPDDARWIEEIPGLSIIGKQHHPNPSANDNMLGISNSKLAGRYAVEEGFVIPRHLALLRREGLAEEGRLGVGTTVYRRNSENIPALWRTWRALDIRPTVSVPVPVGIGKIAKLKYGLNDNELLERMEACHIIDGDEFDMHWEPAPGPHFGDQGTCHDEDMMFIDPLGNVMPCSTFRNHCLGNVTDTPIPELIAIKQAWDKQHELYRNNTVGRFTCICSELCGQ